MWNAASTWNRLSGRVRLAALALLAVGLLTPALAVGGPLAPPAPAGLTVTGGSTSTISVSWSPSAGASAYLLARDGRRVNITRGTSYTFTGLECGKTYSLSIWALAPGSYSTESRTNGSTGACSTGGGGGGGGGGGTTSTAKSFTPSADARVEEAAPSSNLGSETWLKAEDGSDPATESYLLFTVSGLSGSVTNAKLRLRAIDGDTADGPSVYGTGAGWSEGSITYANRPSRTTGAISDSGDIDDGDWVEFDVSSAVRGAGTYSFALVSSTDDGIRFESREVGSKPQLVVTTSSSGGGSPPPQNPPVPPQNPPQNPPPPNDVDAPTVPGALTKTAATSGSVTVSWTASSDTVGVKEYGLYVNNAWVGKTGSTSNTFSGLACGTTLTLGVDAVDAAGNRSARASLPASTSSCATPQPPAPPPTDLQAPSKPSGLTKTGAAETTISLSWTASTDNVAVKEYGLYVNGTFVTTKTTVSHTFAGFGCGTSVVLGVDAVDAAGNRSGRADLPATTAACTTPPAPPSSCSKVASPGQGTAQTLFNSLTAGQTGCLRGGTYTASNSYVLDVSKGSVTITSYPGETALLKGLIVVRNSAVGAKLDDLSIEGTSGASNTIQVYGTDFVLEDSDITNVWRGRSCMILGDSSAGIAVRTVIRRNRFHECGNPSNGNKDHAIYAQDIRDALVTENVFWNIASYALHIYPNAHNSVFSHNVIDGGSPSVRGGIIFGGDGVGVSRNNIVEYNVVAYSATYNIESWWGGSVGSGNIARGNCVFGGGNGNIGPQTGFVAQSTTVADPLFVNRAGRDYRLRAGSPCLTVVGYDTAARLG